VVCRPTTAVLSRSLRGSLFRACRLAVVPRPPEGKGPNRRRLLSRLLALVDSPKTRHKNPPGSRIGRRVRKGLRGRSRSTSRRLSRVRYRIWLCVEHRLFGSTVCLDGVPTLILVRPTKTWIDRT
jgi:hypothetical protein